VSSPEGRQSLFWELAAPLLADPAVSRSTMMGYPCLRADGAFFASIEPATGHLIIKLAAIRVAELIAAGEAAPFAPAGRVFREWAAVADPDPERWRELLREARAFAVPAARPPD
jgi:hypothetical protein